MTTDVAQQQKAETYGLQNVAIIAKAADAVGLPFYAACALMEKESMGRNVYGHDLGGTLSGYPHGVDESNYRVFEWLLSKGGKSNGVGPCQLTWKGFFPDMVARGLKPWDLYDNMVFGMGLFLGYFKVTRSWTIAGTKYNGKVSYGLDMARKIIAWKKRLA